MKGKKVIEQIRCDKMDTMYQSCPSLQQIGQQKMASPMVKHGRLVLGHRCFSNVQS